MSVYLFLLGITVAFADAIYLANMFGSGIIWEVISFFVILVLNIFFWDFYAVTNNNPHEKINDTFSKYDKSESTYPHKLN